MKRSADQAGLLHNGDEDDKSQAGEGENEKATIDRKRTEAAETLLFNSTSWFPGVQSWIPAQHIRWNSNTSLQMTGIECMCLSWSQLCERLKQLGQTPAFAGTVPIVEWHWTADMKVLKIDWIDAANRKLQERLVQRFLAWITMAQVHKVSADQFRSLFVPTPSAPAEVGGVGDQKDALQQPAGVPAHMKINMADQVRLFNIANVLCKLQGEASPANLSVRIEDAAENPNEAFQLHVKGLYRLSSLDLCLLLLPFWIDIDQISIGWNSGVHLIDKAPVVITVWKSAVLASKPISSVWYPLGLVQAPVAAFTPPGESSHFTTGETTSKRQRVS